MKTLTWKTGKGAKVEMKIDNNQFPKEFMVNGKEIKIFSFDSSKYAIRFKMGKVECVCEIPVDIKDYMEKLIEKDYKARKAEYLEKNREEIEMEKALRRNMNW